MSVRSSVPWGDPMSDRAQTEVIGVILLVGMVSIAALGLMLVASGTVADSEAQAEQERVEQSFVQLGHAMTTATANGEMPESVEFDAGESGAITKTDAGTFTIKGGDVNETITVGAIEYEHDDGTIIAYQAGGVWAERGNKTRMLSAPPIRYDPVDETLTMPVTDMNEQRDLSSGPIEVSSTSTDPMRNASLVANDSVTLTIESPYYRGWEKYFKNSAGFGSVRSIDHANNTIEVKFGYFELDEAVQNGATVGGSDDKYFKDHHDNIGSEHQRGTLMPEMDPIIEEMIEDTKADSSTKDPANYSTLENGTYFVDEIDSGTDYDVDLSNGNVTIVVEGDVTVDDGHGITVTDSDPDNVLRIYSGGDKFNLGGDVCVDTDGDDSCNSDATAIQFYGPSTMAVDLGPGEGGTFEGLLYVASSEEKEGWWTAGGNGNCKDHHQVHQQANKGSFTGSLVAYSVCSHSNSNDFSYDDDLADMPFEAYPDEYTLPPQLTYLNIAVHEMDVTNR